VSRLIINLQGSLANPNMALEAAKKGATENLPPGPTGRVDARAMADAGASGVTATCITVGHVVGPGDAVEITRRNIECWNQFLQNPNTVFSLVRNATDITRFAANGKLGVILGFQNTEMLGCDASSVSGFAKLGVRVMQLTYNGANAVGFGCLSPNDQGLTPFGLRVVEAMNESGVSHTACRSLVNNPRNVFDEDLRLLAEHGGVVGIYAMPLLRESGQPTLDDYVRHIEHALHVAGEDHVAIGTDGTITEVDDIETYLHYLGEAVQSRKAAGVSAPGENEAVTLFLPDMTGPSQFEKLASQLGKRGHVASIIDKLLGLNWLRLAGDTWTSHAGPTTP
jgi:membrane dipeptidase